ncbi:MAG: hypothetical protein LBF87_05180 [Treponema sp.]|jgi:hypothetical protein|nr:hypothetical protein [Treponema sp.]
MQEVSAVLSGVPVSDLPLSDLREQYLGEQISRKDFEGRIFQFLMAHYQRFRLFDHDRDAFTDYLCWLYPRLSRAIDAYKEVGASFDAYIGSIVRWSSKEYRSRTADHYITERACWETRAMEDSFTGEYTPTYLTDESFKPVKKTQQVLILLLKSYSFVSDDFIARVAPAIGISPDKLALMIDKLHELREEREEKLRNLQEKLNCQYYRCAAYRRQLQSLPETAARRDAIRGRLERAQARYAKIKQRLATINRGASNSEVAKVLGIPKGTVDSSLYTIKQKAMRGIYKP